MNIKINKKELLDNLNKVSKAITGKANIDALKGVSIQVQNGTIIMLGSDMDLSIIARGKCEVIDPGSVLVDAKIFIEIIRKLPNGEINISLEENLLEISCGKCLFNVVVMNANEYPNLPIENNGTEFMVSKDLFRKMINQVHYAVAQDETRPILQGVLCEVKDSILKLVALDGYRLAYSSNKIESTVDISAVIDGKSLANISKLIDGTGDIKIYLHQNHMEFKLDNLIVYSRLLEGKYISYDSLLPKESKIDVVVDRIELIEAIERSSLMAKNDSSENPTLRFSFKNDGMLDVLVINSNSNKGKGRDELTVEIKSEEKNLEIGFNGRYLLDMLKNMEEGKVLMKYTSSTSPCICQPVDNELSKYLVLPIRLQNN